MSAPGKTVEREGVWIVGRYRAEVRAQSAQGEIGSWSAWDLIGVASSEDVANAACFELRDFFFRVTLDELDSKTFRTAPAVFPRRPQV